MIKLAKFFTLHSYGRALFKTNLLSFLIFSILTPQVSAKEDKMTNSKKDFYKIKVTAAPVKFNIFVNDFLEYENFPMGFGVHAIPVNHTLFFKNNIIKIEVTEKDLKEHKLSFVLMKDKNEIESFDIENKGVSSSNIIIEKQKDRTIYIWKVMIKDPPSTPSWDEAIDLSKKDEKEIKNSLYLYYKKIRDDIKSKNLNSLKNRLNKRTLFYANAYGKDPEAFWKESGLNFLVDDSENLDEFPKIEEIDLVFKANGKLSTLVDKKHNVSLFYFSNTKDGVDNQLDVWFGLVNGEWEIFR